MAVAISGRVVPVFAKLVARYVLNRAILWTIAVRFAGFTDVVAANRRGAVSLQVNGLAGPHGVAGHIVGINILTGIPGMAPFDAFHS